jgi:serine/threonine protein kinase
MKSSVKTIEIPAELRGKVNHVKNRILFLSPSVMSGEERECRKDDFESLANSNIGVGGFGKVYKVRHKDSKNIYAIKVINKAKIIEHDLVEQIKLEVEIMYKLDNKYIVRLHNHYEDDDSFYLILEYAPRGQIYTRLKREGRFSERVSAQFLREVVEAVKYLHSMDPPIIHRDIKPENILLDQDDSIKLADFGWSNFFNEQRTRMTYCGTPEYLAPEMIRQSGHDKSLDIWNLGVLLFELLTGSPPFKGSD